MVIIPCYNEAERLDRAQLSELLKGVKVLLVNDGSSDDTQAVLDDVVRNHPGRAFTLHLKQNSGKGEAVRQGLLHALVQGESEVGYADADFATPTNEILRLEKISRESAAKVVLGSRVKLLGFDVERHALRHYCGRVFATFASIILRLPVYDTQCGAKFFKTTPALREALREPFHSRWAFDVELIGRLLTAPEPILEAQMVEVPLLKWRDVGGSKLGFRAMVKATLDLFRIHLELQARRTKRP